MFGCTTLAKRQPTQDVFNTAAPKTNTLLSQIVTLTPKAPGIAGAFYFFISSNNRPYRPSIPGTIRVLKELAS